MWIDYHRLSQMASKESWPKGPGLVGIENLHLLSDALCLRHADETAQSKNRMPEIRQASTVNQPSSLFLYNAMLFIIPPSFISILLNFHYRSFGLLSVISATLAARCPGAVGCHPDFSCDHPGDLFFRSRGFGSRARLPCVQTFRCRYHGKAYSGLQVSGVFFSRALLRIRRPFHVPFLPGAHHLFSDVHRYAEPFHFLF